MTFRSLQTIKDELDASKAEQISAQHRTVALEGELKRTYRQERIQKLESQKFDYDPKTVTYNECSIPQLEYIVYKTHGPDVKRNERWPCEYI